MNSQIKLITTTNVDHDYGLNYTKLIYVKASDKFEALDIIYKKVDYSEGKRIYSDYDCTGEMFCSPIRARNISWSKARKMYVAKQRWSQDC